MTRRSRMRGLGGSKSLVTKRRHRFENQESVGACKTNGWLTHPNLPEAPSYYLSRLENRELSAQNQEISTRKTSGTQIFGWTLVFMLLVIGKGLWLYFTFDLVVGFTAYVVAASSVVFSLCGLMMVYANRWRGDLKRIEMPYDRVDETGGMLPFDEGKPIETRQLPQKTAHTEVPPLVHTHGHAIRVTSHDSY